MTTEQIQVLVLTLLLVGFIPSTIALFLFEHLHTQREHKTFIIIVVLYATVIGIVISSDNSEVWGQGLAVVGSCVAAFVVWHQFLICSKLHRAQKRGQRILAGADEW